MKQTYRGSCHCGRVKFEVDADLDHVRVCDCSICRRRGALNHRVQPNCFRLLTPLEGFVALYVPHAYRAGLFLPDLRDTAVPPPADRSRVWTINVRCLEGVDLASISITRIYGSRYP